MLKMSQRQPDGRSRKTLLGHTTHMQARPVEMCVVCTAYTHTCSSVGCQCRAVVIWHPWSSSKGLVPCSREPLQFPGGKLAIPQLLVHFLLHTGLEPATLKSQDRESHYHAEEEEGLF